MNKMKKFAMIAVCAMLLVCVTIGATVAYLTSIDQVTNTFTVGKVKIKLDEAKVDIDGKAVTPATRVTENNYKLMPGHEYTKDPTVHVEAESETCWVFVKVENQIADIEADKTIAVQIAEKGWDALAGVPGVYYKEYTSTDDATDLVVFDNFKIKDDVDGTTLAGYEGKTVEVTAYAIQKDGFDTAQAAWDEVSNTPVPTATPTV